MVQYLEEPSASTGNDLLVHRQVAVSIGQGLCVGTRGDKKLRSADNDPAAQAISATNVTKQVVHGKLDGLLGGHTDQIGADAWSTHTHTHTHTPTRVKRWHASAGSRGPRTAVQAAEPLSGDDLAECVDGVAVHAGTICATRHAVSGAIVCTHSQARRTRGNDLVLQPCLHDIDREHTARADDACDGAGHELRHERNLHLLRHSFSKVGTQREHHLLLRSSAHSRGYRTRRHHHSKDNSRSTVVRTSVVLRADTRVRANANVGATPAGEGAAGTPAMRALTPGCWSIIHREENVALLQ